MKCSTKNNFCQVSRLVIYSDQFDLQLSDVSLSVDLLKACEDSDESHETIRISLASIAEIFLPQITHSLLEATDHIDVLVDQNQGLFWSTIKREWFFSNLRELNILKSQNLYRFILYLSAQFFLRSPLLADYRVATLYGTETDYKSLAGFKGNLKKKVETEKSNRSPTKINKKIARVFRCAMRMSQIIWFNTWNKRSVPNLLNTGVLFQVYGSPEDFSDPTVDLFQRYWGGTTEWTRMGDKTVKKKILVIPSVLLEPPDAKTMRLIEESEALRDQIYFWRFFDFKALIYSLYLIFCGTLKSTVFLLFIGRKHLRFETHICTQRLIASFSQDSFRYFKCCIANSIFRSVFSRIADSGGNPDTLFLTYEGQPWEKVFCDTMLNKNSKCDICFYQHAYQRVFDFRFSGDALNLLRRAPYSHDRIRFHLISKKLLDKFGNESLNCFPVKASRYLITNWELNAHDDGISVLIGSDNLVFDELAMGLATIDVERVVYYLPHPVHKNAIDRKVFPNITSKEQINDHGFSWLFCSPYTSLSIELLCSDTSRFSIVNVPGHGDLHRFWPLTTEKVELADLVL